MSFAAGGRPVFALGPSPAAGRWPGGLQTRQLLLGLCALGVLLLWWAVTSVSSTGLKSPRVLELERRIAELESESRRMQLDIAAHVQRGLAEGFSTMVTGPLTGLKAFPPVTVLPAHLKKRILVTGGAGFVGSHLVDVLMQQGHSVAVLDNMFTGRMKNIQHWLGHENFQLFQRDVIEPFLIEVDQIYHLACPASPPHYQYNQIKTIKTSTAGTLNMLGLAKRTKARILFTSTSEIYGDPEVHPQPEVYWGNVNTIGPRSCYDEGKRVAETMCLAYHEEEGVDVRIARIFNTFGPRMHPNDGRVVSNFIIQALSGRPLTVYGKGEQTRSFQYVADLVAGLIKLMNAETIKGVQPVNLGNPSEFTVKDFAEKIRDQVNPSAVIEHKSGTRDDPQKRRPDISLAKRLLAWEPQVSVDEGLAHTIEYFRGELGSLVVVDEKGQSTGSGKVEGPKEGSTSTTGTGHAVHDYAKDHPDWTHRDPSPPTWVATVINSWLTNKEKGWVSEKDAIDIKQPA